MKIALLNSFILNGGDAGIVYGTIDAVRAALPDSELTVFVHHTLTASQLYPDLSIEPMAQDTWPKNRYLSFVMRKSFPFRLERKLLFHGERDFFRNLLTMDVIIYCGGGYINDLYSTNVLFGIIQHTLDTAIPHIAYGHSFGPFFRKSTRAWLTKVLNRFHAITVRDQYSLEQLHKLSVNDARCTFTADAAFSMDIAHDSDLNDLDANELSRILNFKNKSQKRPLLFLSVRKWNFPGLENSNTLTKRYKRELCSFIRRVLGESIWRICFVSTCQDRPGYPYDDAEFAHSLMCNVNEDTKGRVYICNHAFNPRSFPFLISQCADLVLTMRMHFMIYSIMAGVPVMGLAYEQKTIELARQAKINSYTHEIINFSSHDLWQTFLTIQKQKTEVTETIRMAFQRLRKQSLQNAEILKKVLSL